MVFNSGSVGSIVYQMDRRCGTNVGNYPLADKANDANAALDRFFNVAMMSQGIWLMDDTNQTDLPIATTNIVSGQQDYGFSVDMMSIEKVLAKDNTNTWRELVPVDISQTQSDIYARNIWELPSNNSGSPTRFDKFANSILLDPIPNYNSTGGLKIVFNRGPSYFVAADTTKVPGIPTIFHSYIVNYASLQFCIDKGRPQKNDIASLVARDEEAIQEFYSKRNKDERTVIRYGYRSPR